MSVTPSPPKFLLQLLQLQTTLEDNFNEHKTCKNVKHTENVGPSPSSPQKPFTSPYILQVDKTKQLIPGDVKYLLQFLQLPSSYHSLSGSLFTADKYRSQRSCSLELLQVQITNKQVFRPLKFFFQF